MKSSKSKSKDSPNPQNSGSSYLPPGTIIKSKWKIQHLLGKGAFGETYAAYDIHTNEEVAIKIEKLDSKKMVLRLEVIALKKLQSCPYVVRYKHSGRQDDFNFLVMERLQDNLATLRKKMPRGTFSMCTTLKLGVQMIDALEGCHKLGYIHRDVKPSNFVTGRAKNRRGRIYIIDFGLARKYRLPNGEIRPPRKSAGFRGTARYASINSHRCKELGRRDDLWSVFYVLVEFALGSLPWRRIKDKEHIGELKERFTNAELVKELPKEFLLFMQSLQKLGYADEPDYDYLRGLLLQVYSREGYPPDAPFDWQIKDNIYNLPPAIDVTSLIDAEKKISNSSGKSGAKQDENNYYNVFQNGPKRESIKALPPAKKLKDEEEDSSKESLKQGCRRCIIL